MQQHDQLVKFLKRLCPTGKVEFSDLTKTYTFKEALEAPTDIYFLASVKDPTKRNGDDGVIFKNYFVLDFDVRENTKNSTGELLEDDVLKIVHEVIVDKLEAG